MNLLDEECKERLFVCGCCSHPFTNASRLSEHLKNHLGAELAAAISASSAASSTSSTAMSDSTSAGNLQSFDAIVCNLKVDLRSETFSSVAATAVSTTAAATVASDAITAEESQRPSPGKWPKRVRMTQPKQHQQQLLQLKAHGDSSGPGIHRSPVVPVTTSATVAASTVATLAHLPPSAGHHQLTAGLASPSTLAATAPGGVLRFASLARLLPMPQHQLAALAAQQSLSAVPPPRFFRLPLPTPKHSMPSEVANQSSWQRPIQLRPTEIQLPPLATTSSASRRSAIEMHQQQQQQQHQQQQQQQQRPVKLATAPADLDC